jgi:D-3-phosphoglycerate dehydrogenase|tara:strand:- start:726 stop:1745 length:1020 start_codon:yes stop_codon:yes gene_type:complete
MVVKRKIYMKILHLEKNAYDEESKRMIESLGNVDYLFCKNQADLTEIFEAKNYNVLFSRIGLDVNANVLSLAGHLKWIMSPTTGLDHIDLHYTEENKIKVISLKGETEFLKNIHTTAEHTWALLLCITRKVSIAHNAVLKGLWSRGDYFCNELSGKKLGIIGYGRLGKIVAGYGTTFNMDVLVFDKLNRENKIKDDRVKECGLNELISKSDVISLHLPLNQSTHGFLSEDRINLMKEGSILINTARGGLIDEEALIKALGEGKIAGAALDVIADDSKWDGQVPSNHPVVEYAKRNDNLIITPHIGGYGYESVFSTRRFLVKKFINSLNYSKSNLSINKV